MGPIVLPSDVIGVIVEYLAVNKADQRDLQSCSLVCKAWVPIGRQHIFQNITFRLDRESDRERVMRFVTIIHQQPSIGRFVQEIFCSCGSTYRISRWSDPMFLNLLNLPSVRVLSIIIYYGDMSYEKWSPNQFGLRLIMEHYLGARTLKDFRISGFKNLPMAPIVSSKHLSFLYFHTCDFESKSPMFPSGMQLSVKQLEIYNTRNVDPSFFHCFPLLEELTIGKVTLTTHTSSHSSALHPLHHLHTINFWSGVKWSALCPLRPTQVIGTKVFPALRKLNMDFLEADDVEEGNVIFDHAGALEQVNVSVGYYIQQTRDFSSFDIHGLMFNSRNTLKKMLLGWPLNGYDRLEAFTKRICDVLELIQGNNVLETLVFPLTYTPENADRDLNSDFPQWKRFADIFQDDNAFSNLKQISFKIKLMLASATLEQDANRNLEQLLDEPLAGLANNSRFSFLMDVRIKRLFDF